jgi:eukaryotic-like serine/threonine-protein kinase
VQPLADTPKIKPPPVPSSFRSAERTLSFDELDAIVAQEEAREKTPSGGKKGTVRTGVRVNSFGAEGDPNPVRELTKNGRHIPTAVLGQGGMGKVYSAKEPLLHREVALKTMLKRTPSNSAYWRRFMREAQITAQLSHPSIIPVYGVDFDEHGQPFLIMKKIEGKTLGEYIESAGKHSDKEKFGFKARIDRLIHVCSAVSYAHENGVVHRDLKPENIMVGAFDEIIVMDWGSARIQTDEESVGAVDEQKPASDFAVKTMHGALVGTPLYMAPEQALGKNQDVGPHSDQFALGMVLYELIEEKPARSGGALHDVLLSASRGATLSFRDGFPPQLRSIIEKATALEIADRYDSVAAFSRDLRRFIRGEPVQAHPERLPRRIWRQLAAHPFLSVGTLVASLLLSLMMVINSLSVNLSHQKMIQAKQKSTAMLIATVSSRARIVDNILGNIQLQLHGLTRAASLKYGLDADGDCLAPEQLPSHESALLLPEFDPYYVSVERPVCLLAPGVSPEEAKSSVELGINLRPDMLSVGYTGSSDTSMENIGAKIQWVYVGTEAGVLINYPGLSYFHEEYDPRQRPWYLTGKLQKKPMCTDPYPDASGMGYLLPCSQRVEDVDGNFVGVAGIDLELDRVIEIIKDRDGFILNEDLEIIVQAKDQGVRLSSEEALQGNKWKDVHALNNPALLSELQFWRENGVVQDTESGDYFTYARLQFVPWVLVLRFGPDEV